MIPPHTVFLLQFAKYRPDCAAKLAASALNATGPRPKKPRREHRVPPLRRLLRLFEFAPVQNCRLATKFTRPRTF